MVELVVDATIGIPFGQGRHIGFPLAVHPFSMKATDPTEAHLSRPPVLAPIPPNRGVRDYLHVMFSPSPLPRCEAFRACRVIARLPEAPRRHTQAFDAMSASRNSVATLSDLSVST